MLKGYVGPRIAQTVLQALNELNDLLAKWDSDAGHLPVPREESLRKRELEIIIRNHRYEITEVNLYNSCDGAYAGRVMAIYPKGE